MVGLFAFGLIRGLGGYLADITAMMGEKEIFGYAKAVVFAEIFELWRRHWTILYYFVALHDLFEFQLSKLSASAKFRLDYYESIPRFNIKVGDVKSERLNVVCPKFQSRKLAQASYFSVCAIFSTVIRDIFTTN